MRGPDLSKRGSAQFPGGVSNLARLNSPLPTLKQPLAPFSSTPVGVQLRSPGCPAPSPALPSSQDRKVSVALTRPLDLRSCSQNNPLAGPAPFRAGGRGASNPLGLQIQAVALGLSRKSENQVWTATWWLAFLWVRAASHLGVPRIRRPGEEPETSRLHIPGHLYPLELRGWQTWGPTTSSMP